MHLPELVTGFNESFASVLYATINYSTVYHPDADDEGYSYGVWLLKHSKTCKHKNNEYLKDWYFLFPQIQMKIQLQHNCFIIWNAKDWIHATSKGNPTDITECFALQYATCMTNKRGVLHA